MTDEQLVQAFEDTTLPADQFTHALHVRAGWLYVRRFGLGIAIHRFSMALRRFATAKGAPEKYHETMTVAWLLVIAERLNGAEGLDWEAFADRHADLFVSRPSILARYYRDETLLSLRARRGFTMPDHIAPPT
jgi:hypothetical protein